MWGRCRIKDESSEIHWFVSLGAHIFLFFFDFTNFRVANVQVWMPTIHMNHLHLGVRRQCLDNYSKLLNLVLFFHSSFAYQKRDHFWVFA